jgi:hypothetical protein
LANWDSSLAGAYTAASPADTRASLRSKETIGRLIAMYSMILFMVDTSLSGLRGSGERHTSAVDR